MDQTGKLKVLWSFSREVSRPWGNFGCLSFANPLLSKVYGAGTDIGYQSSVTITDIQGFSAQEMAESAYHNTIQMFRSHDGLEIESEYGRHPFIDSLLD